MVDGSRARRLVRSGQRRSFLSERPSTINQLHSCVYKSKLSAFPRLLPRCSGMSTPPFPQASPPKESDLPLVFSVTNNFPNIPLYESNRHCFNALLFVSHGSICAAATRDEPLTLTTSPDTLRHICIRSCQSISRCRTAVHAARLTLFRRDASIADAPALLRSHPLPVISARPQRNVSMTLIH